MRQSKVEGVHPCATDQFDAVPVRQVDVDEHEIRPIRGQRLPRLRDGAHRPLHPEARGGRHNVGVDACHPEIIVNHQY